MVPEQSRWVRFVCRIAAWRASEEALGDVLEEYAGGKRTRFWLVGQILSTLPRSSPRFVINEKGSANMLSNLSGDVRYVLRTLRRSPGFALATIAPIALGIGITTGTFSILNDVMYRPLPVPAPDELFTVYQEFRGVQKRRVHGARIMFSLPEYRTYRDATTMLSGITAHTIPRTVTLGGTAPHAVQGVLVACNYFDVLRLRPSIGTGFTPANCDDGTAPPVVVLSYAFWTTEFSADPEIIRKTISLNGQNVAVVGVAPQGFDGTELARASFFASLSLQPAFNPETKALEDPQVSWLTLLARRRENTGIEQVRAELAVTANRIDQQQPGRTTTLLVAPATALPLPGPRRDFLRMARIVLTAFGLILLIACANVANVLLARGAARSRELAVRLAIGAPRSRLVQLLLTESTTIALLGAVTGSVLAWWSFQALLPSLLASVPGVSLTRLDLRPNLTVLWFGLVLTAATALACGLVPALRASKQELHAAMKQDAGQPKDHSAGWLRGTLISVQVAVCMVLLISAALLLRALHAAYTVDPGFEYRNIAVVSVDLRGPHYSETAIEAFRTRMIEQIRSLPAVVGVTQASKVPLSSGRHQTTFRLPHDQEAYEVDMNSVSPEFFSLLEIPIVSGRTFTPAELKPPTRAVIVTEATTRRFWPGENPVGRTIVMDRDVTEIVGIAKDAQVSRIGSTESRYLYLPAVAAPEMRRLTVLVRSDARFETLAANIRAGIGLLDRSLVAEIKPLQANLEFWQTQSRAMAILSGSLSVLALLLASVGVYGVVSYLVTRRRREVGIRMTLGASPRALQGLILRETLRPVWVGLLVGVLGAAATSQVLETSLFGISPLDPLAFLGAAMFLLIVAATATLVPTREALRIDPMTALRHE